MALQYFLFDQIQDGGHEIWRRLISEGNLLYDEAGKSRAALN